MRANVIMNDVISEALMPSVAEALTLTAHTAQREGPYIPDALLVPSQG